ncbi:PPOX class F420-dependent oxidoreductase [Amycolatopsis acidicola]|uniref:PPOX class F420-dependent oxidoreductase n=1 Tax=Amycolatopsis acidicola TaxID=2596893 RepID=A0A5N0UK98_9PSEU|nr:PPOX class F420-dependent oxidoreductase [Amycolatopsis acidicola]KAA9149837.1 PPOX class F420-dependent oxidoreductase [Amycolatopsis acidicola]
MTTTLATFAKQNTALLTTFKRDGTPVGTPVTLAVEGDHAYFHTYDAAWKVKRMRNNPEVEIAPSSLSGKTKGPAMRATVRLVEGDEAAHAKRLLARSHPILHGVLVPVSHRLKHWKTLHYVLRPLP